MSGLTRIDQPRARKMLAAGMPIEEVAKALGVTEVRLKRSLGCAYRKAASPSSPDRWKTLLPELKARLRADLGVEPQHMD